MIRIWPGVWASYLHLAPDAQTEFGAFGLFRPKTGGLLGFVGPDADGDMNGLLRQDTAREQVRRRQGPTCAFGGLQTALSHESSRGKGNRVEFSLGKAAK
jgi:hypothetical protein